MAYIFRQKFWSTSVDQSVDFRISAKIRGKKRLFSWLWKMAGGGLQFELWICRSHFKTYPRDVFSSSPTPIFISWTFIEKSKFQNFEKWPFWAIFWPFLLYFSLKNVKNVFLLHFCIDTGKTVYFMVTINETDVVTKIYWITWYHQGLLTKVLTVLTKCYMILRYPFVMKSQMQVIRYRIIDHVTFSQHFGQQTLMVSSDPI